MASAHTSGCRVFDDRSSASVNRPMGSWCGVKLIFFPVGFLLGEGSLRCPDEQASEYDPRRVVSSLPKNQSVLLITSEAGRRCIVASRSGKGREPRRPKRRG